MLDRPWSWLRQVHGSDVVVVDRPGGRAGATADAAVSADAGAALAVLVADCAPVAFASAESVIGVAHAGWRGLLGGVVEATVAAMRGLGASAVDAALGPCIHAECYEFGAPDLDLIVDRLGPGVRAEDKAGRPALDLPAAIRVVLERSGVELRFDADVCTSCSPRHYSHRAAGDVERQAAVVWLP